jgi:hypothetical protein
MMTVGGRSTAAADAHFDRAGSPHDRRRDRR